MRRVLLALAILLAMAVRPAASQGAAVMTTVNQFVSSFNRGDTAMVAAICADETSIIDEFPPHAWAGRRACIRWMADYDADAKQNAISDGVVTLSAPSHIDVTGDRAYVVVPANYEYKRNGQAVKETGSIFTLVLQRSAATWRITAWSWAKN